MAYQMAATAVTLTDTGCRPFQMQCFKHLCSILHDFNWLCLRGSSPLAELVQYTDPRLHAVPHHVLYGHSHHVFLVFQHKENRQFHHPHQIWNGSHTCDKEDLIRWPIIPEVVNAHARYFCTNYLASLPAGSSLKLRTPMADPGRPGGMPPNVLQFFCFAKKQQITWHIGQLLR